MPTLSDRLKALGVQIGAKDLSPVAPQYDAKSLKRVLSGKEVLTPQGEAFLVEEHIPLGSQHGRSKISLEAPLDILGVCLSIPSLASLPTESFIFLDTETTGLSGGSGTYTFLIGAGRIIRDAFVMRQFFLRDPAEEPAQLHSFEEFLAPSQVIVTFNGKSFDIPLLTTRFLTHGWHPPFSELIHIDLLHISRRLWRNRLPSRTLGNLEVHILDADRTEEDVPGWQIPSLYFEYLLDGDANRLRPVFYHNKMDVISLAVLLDHIACLLTDPINGAGTYGADLIATGRLFEQIGDLDSAAQLYIHALQHEDVTENRLPKEILLDALSRLAYIHKRQENFDSAVNIWKQSAALNRLDAHIELAKYYEHRVQDIPAAIMWTTDALKLIEGSNADQVLSSHNSFYTRSHVREELLHRLDRLNRKSTSTE